MKKFLILLGILLIPCGVFAQTIGGGGGSTSPGGTTGQTQFNNGGNFGGFTLGGDCTLAQPMITCTKTNNVALGTAATANTGTSGATLGFLNGNLTFAGNNSFTGSPLYFGGANPANSVEIDSVASAVDALKLTGGVTGNPGSATVGVVGTDTNISINVTPKGTGVVNLNGNTITNTLSANGTVFHVSNFQDSILANQLAIQGTSILPAFGANGEGALSTTTANGMLLGGQGSTNDITIQNKSAAAVLSIPTGTTAASINTIAQLEPNNGSTAPVLNKFAKLSAGTATVLATTDTAASNVIGVCIANCTTSGNAVIATGGIVNCVFDGATTQGDYVIASTTVGGDCHDGGATLPVGVTVFGFVQSTNGGAGTYSIDINQVGVIAANTSTKSNFVTAAFTMTNYGGLW
jgi:hypothetical protein